MVTRTRVKPSVLGHADADIERARGGDMVTVTPGRDVEAASDPEIGLDKALTETGEISDVDELEAAELHETDRLIRSKLSEMGIAEGTATVRLFRAYQGNPRDMAFVDEIPLPEYSYKFLSDTYGGGFFNIKVYVPKYTEDGSQLGVKLIVNQRFRVEGRPKEPKRLDDLAPIQSGNDLLQIGKIMSDGFQQLGRMIVEARPKEKSTMDFARELATIKSLFVDANAKAAPDPFTMVERLASAMSVLRPPAEGESGAMSEMIRLFGPVIRDAVTKPAGAPVAPPSIEAPPDALQNPVADELPLEGGEVEPTFLIYKGYVMLLARHARANNPTEPIASQILEEAPTEFIDWVSRQTDLVEVLAKYDGSVRNFPDWFKRLHADLIRLNVDDDTAA